MAHYVTSWLIRGEVPSLGLLTAAPREVFAEVPEGATPAPESEIIASTWPPSTGDYDHTAQPGELKGLSMRMSFEEVRAALEPVRGMPISTSPSLFPKTGNRTRNNRNTKGQPNGRRRYQ